MPELARSAHRVLAGVFPLRLLAGIIVVEVFRRYGLDAASTWGEETAIYAFIWLSYIAAAKGVRSRRHLAVDTFGIVCLALASFAPTS